MAYAVLRLFFLPVVVFSLYSTSVFADLMVDQHINKLVDMAVNGDKEQFLQLVKDENLINKKDAQGHTPIYAALFGPPELSNDLLDLGASLEQKDNLGFTPLISAALLGYPQAVSDLLNRGANIEARNSDGQTALMISVLGLATNQGDTSAASDNHWHNRWAKVIDVLIRHGADVNTMDERGVSPLFMAIFSQDYELCRALIEAGANTNHKLPSGVSLLRFAKISSSRDIVDMLIAHGAKL